MPELVEPFPIEPYYRAAFSEPARKTALTPPPPSRSHVTLTPARGLAHTWFGRRKWLPSPLGLLVGYDRRRAWNLVIVIVIVPRLQLLQPVAFIHQPLQAGFVEDIKRQLLAGEHGESGTASARRKF
jgi:hypothetical protein